MDYSIVEQAENVKDSKIEKLGVVVYFTMAELDKQDEQLKKALVEVEAQTNYYAARMANVENNHVFSGNTIKKVTDFSDEDLFAAHMYQEAKAAMMVGSNKVKQLKKQLEDDEIERAEIVKQIPELAVVVEPEVAPTKDNLGVSDEVKVEVV